MNRDKFSVKARETVVFPFLKDENSLRQLCSGLKPSKKEEREKRKVDMPDCLRLLLGRVVK